MADEEKVPVEESESAPMKMSRRDFLIGAGAGVVVTGVAAAAVISTRQPETVEVIKEVPVPGETVTVGTVLPATVRAVTLNIDSKSYDVVVDVRESLWDTVTHKLGLRDRINLGCDRAQCGACTVTVDGRAVNGCTILSARLGRGQQIMTVSGISKGTRTEDLHPVSRAFWQQGGFQCGICTRGFVMSAYALLLKNPNPNDDDIREALSGNICRCSEYPKMYDAVFKAAEELRAG